MTNDTLQFAITNALNEFESYGLGQYDDTSIPIDEYQNELLKRFDQLRGDLYKIIEIEINKPETIKSNRRAFRDKYVKQYSKFTEREQISEIDEIENRYERGQLSEQTYTDLYSVLRYLLDGENLYFGIE